MKKIFSLLFSVVFLFCLFGCNSSTTKGTDTVEKQTLHEPAKSTAATQPRLVMLDTCPKPQTLVIPSKPTSCVIKTRSGPKTIQLIPPETKPAGFFAQMQHYTTDQGLALDAISCSCIDHFGNLWFGTYGGGVSRYDGKSFTTFTTAQGLGNNIVRSILEDKTGNLWFGTYGGGVSRYDGKSFTTFTTAQGLGNKTVLSILQDNEGNMWFGTTGGGVSRYDGKSFSTFTASKGLLKNNVSSIFQDKAGNLWFGTEGGGVSRYSMHSKTGKLSPFTTYTNAEGLANNFVKCMIQDKAGNFWFGTDKGGVSHFDGQTFTNYTTAEGLANNTVISIYMDKAGNLWFGTEGGGASCYNGKSFINFTTEQGLANNTVWSIVEDKAGNLWFGTEGGGVSRYDGKSFTSYTTVQGLANNIIWSIFEDKTGKLWFGTDGGGVSCYDDQDKTGSAGSFTTFTTAQGIGNNTVLSTVQDKEGNLWFGTYGSGVSRYDGKSFTWYTSAQGLGSNTVLSVLRDKDENLWFGTYKGGVSKYDGKFIATYTTAQGLGNNTVLSILQDKAGNIWFGTEGGGVSRFDGKTFTTYTTAQGLGNNIVRNMIEYKDGNIWFGTEGGGVSRFDGKTFMNFTTAQGLPDNTVSQIVLSPYPAELQSPASQKNGVCLILGTNFGLAVLTGWKDKTGKFLAFGDNPGEVSNEELKNYTPVFAIYNSSTGYPVKDLVEGQSSMYKDSKGQVWIGTGSDKTALVRFDPSAVNRNPDPPTVLIQSIKINEENICWYTEAKQKSTKDQNAIDSATLAQQEFSTFGKTLSIQERDTMRKKFASIKFDGITSYYPLPEHLVLPYQFNHITFEFAAIEPARPYLVKYQYILDGYDKEWSPLSNKTNASFGNIYEGSYTFRLKAQSPDGVWSEPVVFTFSVLPPWYRTWWMYLIYVLALIALVVAIVMWNSKRLIARANELKEEVRKATETIVEQKQVVEEKNKDILDSIHYAKRIQDALLKEEEHISEHLSEHFILFIPKDIVSGDFYWSAEKQGQWYFAAVDCTGHGVPGAFLSILGMSFLNEIISESKLHTASEVLDELRGKILIELGQTGKEGENWDGMDISLIRLNLKTNELHWAGANNPLNIIRNNHQLEEVKPDKQPIGYYPELKPFTNHIIQLQKGDTIYFFSDGYADQFGGPKGKKFMYAQLKEVLLSIHQKPIKEQKQMLRDIFEKWKGNLLQVDDVCIIGVKV